MNAYLMYKDRDFDFGANLPQQADALVADLGLEALFGAMSSGNKPLAEVVKRAVLGSVTDIETICYRQEILKDCMNDPAVVREIYDLAVETLESKRRNHYFDGGRHPRSILYRAVNLLEMLVAMLRRLRTIVDRHASSFRSEGFCRLFASLAEELDDEYFATIERHLNELKFDRGILLSARLGEGNKGTDYVLRKQSSAHGDWLTRLFAPKAPAFSYELHPRDESGARALSQLNDRGINLVANAVAQSAEHLTSFFEMLRTELAFYVGCLNLHDRLSELGESICLPSPCPVGARRYSATGLYDVSLTLSANGPVVSNDLAADGKTLIIITGANQGGKSTFLRSVGLAQLMMQCGMFAPAEALCADVCERVVTHYKREEDATMNSGKFDEELRRLSDIVDGLRANSLILFNESFAATNEREGSEIARQIVDALIENDVKVFFVTHQYAFAHGLQTRDLPSALFLRAERLDDGRRTFKIAQGAPLETSYGPDLYREVFVEPATS